MRSTAWRWRLLFCAIALGPADGGFAQGDFPYDSELVLDVAPMRGSKRIPNLEVAPNGAMILEMWCNKVDGQIVLAADTITVLAGPPTDRPCPPERAAGDAELLAAVTAATTWHWDGHILQITGPSTLRFRKASN
jgi:heat shock protein HslJ